MNTQGLLMHTPWQKCVKTGPWSNGSRWPGLKNSGLIAYLGKKWHQDALWKKGKLAVAVWEFVLFCWKTLHPGIYVDVNLAHTKYINIVESQIHFFLATIFHIKRIPSPDGWFDEQNKMVWETGQSIKDTVLASKVSKSQSNRGFVACAGETNQIHWDPTPHPTLQNLRNQLLTSWCQTPEHTFIGHTKVQVWGTYTI